MTKIPEPSATASQTKPLTRAARGSALNVSGAALSAAANLGLAVIVSRIAPQTDAGLFFSATSFMLIAIAFGQLGTDTGLVYYISGARSQGKSGRTRLYMRVAGVPVLALSLGIAALLFVLADPIGALLSPGRESEFASLLRTMAWFLPFGALFHLVLAGSRGLGTMKMNALLDQATKPTVQLGFVAIFLVTIPHLAAIAWAAAYVPLSVVALLWWRSLLPHVDDTDRALQQGERAKFWLFSAPRAIATIAQVAMQRLDIILVGSLLGLAEAAIYAATTRFLVLGQAGANAVSMSVQPLLRESLAAADLTAAKSLYRTTTAWLILATWPLYFVLIVFAPILLSVFGSDYADSGAPVLVVLGGAMLVATACGMVDMVLLMSGRTWLNLANVLLALTAFVLLDLWLIPRMGIIGAALGWSAAILIANIIPLAQVFGFLRIQPFGKVTIVAMLIPSVTFGLIPLGYRCIWGNQPIDLAIQLGIALLCYLALAFVFRRQLSLNVFVSALLRRRVSKRALAEAPS